MKVNVRASIAALTAIVILIAAPLVSGEEHELLNVSYDPTGELYAECNAALAKYYQDTIKKRLTLRGSFHRPADLLGHHQ
jgi:ABC-type sulfate transport system substrate-binding protein